MGGASPSKQLDSLWALLYAFAPNERSNPSRDSSLSLASNPGHHKAHNISIHTPNPRNAPPTRTPTRCTAAEASRGSRDNGNGRTKRSMNSISVRKLCPSLPSDTMRVLAAAAKIHAEYARDHCVYRKGFHTDNSKTLELRIANNIWHPRHGRPNPNSTIEDGADFRQLGTYFQAILHHWGLLDRIHSFRDSGRVPRAACDVTKFHREYWVAFQNICEKPFRELARAQQTTAFETFLFEKFSTDPKKRRMVPIKGTKPRKLSWAGFWLTQVEVERISAAVVTAFHQGLERGQSHQHSADISMSNKRITRHYVGDGTYRPHR